MSHIEDINLRQRRADHRERHGMLSGVARFHTLPIAIVLRGRPMMLVCGRPVIVLGMIVIGIRVDVQRRDLARRCGHDRSDEERDEAMHKPHCM